MGFCNHEQLPGEAIAALRALGLGREKDRTCSHCLGSPEEKQKNMIGHLVPFSLVRAVTWKKNRRPEVMVCACCPST